MATSRVIRPTRNWHLHRLLECGYSSDKSTDIEVDRQRCLASSTRSSPARRNANKNLPNYDAVNAASYTARLVDNAETIRRRNHLPPGDDERPTYVVRRRNDRRHECRTFCRAAAGHRLKRASLSVIWCSGKLVLNRSQDRLYTASHSRVSCTTD